MRNVKIAKVIKKNKINIPAKYRIIIKSFKELGGILNNYAIKNRSIEEVIEMENNIASEMFSK
jgi:hypothetical protein